ncbi:MAG TPA: LytTR family DNA-binding domain-containing protein [Flavisolibacter sp.]|nr:LytTR family DNA-binding domain-containing protein [Flavisolibacter sp.]
MKIKTVIVEDEPLSRKLLETYCEKCGLLKLSGSYETADEALEFLNTQDIQLLFLDVEMPGINGFELLDRMSYMPKVILTTSKTEYAYTAFQYDVVDFLKKPIQYNRFLAALNKIKQISNDPQTPAEDDFYIKSSGKFVKLRYNDVLFVESLGDYVKYVTEDKSYVTHSTLKMVEEKMSNGPFMKVHRSFIVNLQKVKDIKYYTLAISGKTIPISKSLKAEVLKRLKIVE